MNGIKLWKESTTTSSPGTAIQAKIKDIVLEINRKVIKRGVRCTNALRNAELEILKGQRNGKKYRKPYTKKATYCASAPGEVPARRTGALRLQWIGGVEESATPKGVVAVSYLESNVPYASYLEEGTGKMAARPFADKIKKQAEPEIQKIMSESYD